MLSVITPSTCDISTRILNFQEINHKLRNRFFFIYLLSIFHKYINFCLLDFFLSSGVATLSCTDSSAASGEETSDPGSPYSPSSCDDTQQRTSLLSKSTTPHTMPGHLLVAQPLTVQAQLNANINNNNNNNDKQQNKVMIPPNVPAARTWKFNTETTSAVNAASLSFASINGAPTTITTMSTSAPATTMTVAKNVKNGSCSKVKRAAITNITTGMVKKTRLNIVNQPIIAAITTANAPVPAMVPIPSAKPQTTIEPTAVITISDDETVVPSPPVALAATTALQKPISIVECVKNINSDATNATKATKAIANIAAQTHIYNPQMLGAQTKITGFFKSQVKPMQANAKKSMANMAIRSTAFTSIKSNGKHFCNQLTKPDEYVSSHGSKATDDSSGSSDDVRVLNTIPSALAANRKVERKTAKVAPFASTSRRPNTHNAASSKKSLPPVLPKKPVNIAPRTMDITANTNGNFQMMSSVKCNEMQQQLQQQQQKALMQPKVHQSTVLLRAIRIPPHQPKNIQHQAKTAPKIGTQMFQFASSPVMPKLVQIPNIVPPKEDAAASHNLLINNGNAHYFLNGAVIKLQQMAQPHVAATLEAVNSLLQKSQPQFGTTKPMPMPMPENQLPKDGQTIADAVNGEQSSQTTNQQRLQTDQLPHHHSHHPHPHSQLASHFAASAAAGPHFAQPVFVATSSGLLLTAALPTVMSSSNMAGLQGIGHQPHPHQQQHAHQSQPTLPTLHQFNQTSHGPSVGILPNMHAAASFVSSAPGFPFMPMAAATATQAFNQDNHHHPHSHLHHHHPHHQTHAIINIPTPLPATAMSTTKSVATVAASVTTLTSTTSPAICQPKVTTSMSMLPTVQAKQLTAAVANNIPHHFATMTPITSSSMPAAKLVDVPFIQSNGHVHSTHSSMSVTVKTIPTANDLLSTAVNGPMAITPIKPIPEITITSVSTSPMIWSQTSTPQSKLSNASASTAALSTTTSKRANSPLALVKPCVPSPKSVLLEKIQQETAAMPVLNGTSTPKGTKSLELLNTPTTIDTDLSNITLPECSKSPILSQPKTIRFPARQFANGSHRTDSRVIGACYWDSCHAKCETSSNLIDHLQTQHVNSQTGPFTCRWANCKVHGRESCSRKWLERHVLSHGGSKFFKCIFDKCRMRFSSHVSYLQYQQFMQCSCYCWFIAGSHLRCF